MDLQLERRAVFSHRSSYFIIYDTIRHHNLWNFPISGSFRVPPRPVVQPTSLSEWQLLAVLHKANLVQYYETFISKGIR